MPKLLISDRKGNISASAHLGACGMKAGIIYMLEPHDLIKLPAGSKIFMLPSRLPIGYDETSGNFIQMEAALSAAAFLAPGYTATLSAAYEPIGKPNELPLFSYTAVCMYNDSLYAAAVQVDKDKRHDYRYIDMALVQNGISKLTKIFPENRLIAHLKHCALVSGCPNAQNFFLSRYEAPLPSSPSCNALCVGCISYQPGKKCPVSQPRIKFVPSCEELSEIALFHIERARNPIVSFGQGCEGEPLLQGKVLESAIALIREKTPRGTIHMNTNGSRPDALGKLLDADLDSVRISMNSAREDYYFKYYRPKGYAFRDVLRSIKIAKDKKAFVSINYLTMPGFTDQKDEYEAFRKLIRKYNIDMIQWRNLNYDPLRYFEELKFWPKSSELLGIKTVIQSLKKEFPRLKMGYFNPAVSSTKTS